MWAQTTLELTCAHIYKHSKLTLTSPKPHHSASQPASPRSTSLLLWTNRSLNAPCPALPQHATQRASSHTSNSLLPEVGNCPALQAEPASPAIVFCDFSMECARCSVHHVPRTGLQDLAPNHCFQGCGCADIHSESSNKHELCSTAWTAPDRWQPGGRQPCGFTSTPIDMLSAGHNREQAQRTFSATVKSMGSTSQGTSWVTLLHTTSVNKTVSSHQASMQPMAQLDLQGCVLTAFKMHAPIDPAQSKPASHTVSDDWLADGCIFKGGTHKEHCYTCAPASIASNADMPASLSSTPDAFANGGINVILALTHDTLGISRSWNCPLASVSISQPMLLPCQGLQRFKLLRRE